MVSIYTKSFPISKNNVQGKFLWGVEIFIKNLCSFDVWSLQNFTTSVLIDLTFNCLNFFISRFDPRFENTIFVDSLFTNWRKFISPIYWKSGKFSRGSHKIVYLDIIIPCHTTKLSINDFDLNIVHDILGIRHSVLIK